MRLNIQRHTLAVGTHEIPVSDAADYYRVSAAGGTVNIRPVFVDNAEVYTQEDISDSSTILETPALEAIEFAVTVGAAFVQIGEYSDT